MIFLRLFIFGVFALSMTSAQGDERRRRFLPGSDFGKFGKGFRGIDLKNFFQGYRNQPNGLGFNSPPFSTGGLSPLKRIEIGRNQNLGNLLDFRGNQDGSGNNGGGGLAKNFVNQKITKDYSRGGKTAPSSGGHGFLSAALDETNNYRAMHGAGPLTLDSELSAGCQSWAEQLAETNTFKHSCEDCSEYGENLFFYGGSPISSDESAKKAVKAWYNEVKMYDFNNPGFNFRTGHFTALVWVETNQMGFGVATNAAGTKTYVVARYVPAGNMEGAFEENVLPLQ